ncbi:hypothetical protein LXL04_029473 [Taraxacum kok-saghyz]
MEIIKYNTKRVCHKYDTNDWLKMCYNVTHSFSGEMNLPDNNDFKVLETTENLDYNEFRDLSKSYEERIQQLQKDLSLSKEEVNRVESSMLEALGAKNGEIEALVNSIEMEELASTERRAEEERAAHNATKMACTTAIAPPLVKVQWGTFLNQGTNPSRYTHNDLRPEKKSRFTILLAHLCLIHDSDHNSAPSFRFGIQQVVSELKHEDLSDYFKSRSEMTNSAHESHSVLQVL